MGRRSPYGSCLVKSVMSERAWSERLPEAIVVRPTHCVRCGRGAFEGGGVSIHSHGTRLRHQVGPLEYGRSVERRVVVARRYRCARPGCGTVMLVVPRSVVPKKQHSAGAIASSVANWSGFYSTPKSSRAESAGAFARWRQPERWAAEIVTLRLFASVPRHPKASRRTREGARTLVQSIAGRAPSGTPYEAVVFAGAERVP
jgi:hypothetical protein